MRNLIVSNSVTLDGKVDEVRGWALPGDDEEFVKHQTELLSHSDGLLLGRGTYEFFAAVWPSRSGEFPDRMNKITKYVASTTLTDVEWENSQLIEGDLRRPWPSSSNSLVTTWSYMARTSSNRVCWSTTSSTSINSGSTPSCSARGGASSRTGRNKWPSSSSTPP